MAARNMQRLEINIHEKLWVKLDIYKDHVRRKRACNLHRFYCFVELKIAKRKWIYFVKK